MDAESADALEVLKDVWRGQEQSAADIDGSTESHCRKMTDAGVGHDDYAAGDETDRITAWRSRLEAARPASGTRRSRLLSAVGYRDQRA